MAGKAITVAVLGAAAVGIQTWLLPVVNHLGIGRAVLPLHDTVQCKPVNGLEACEDHWIHRQSGISYLPCSTIPARQQWCPAMDMLNGHEVEKLPSDTIKMYDTNTGTVSTIVIDNPPAHLDGKLHLHAIDAFADPRDPEKLTFFINNHGVPTGGQSAHAVGADSTVEIFETRLGSKNWKHVQTVRHELILTPNNLLATGPRSFYVSNDHFSKTSQLRTLPLIRLPGAKSSIVHCQASSVAGQAPDCIEAASGIQYPNGIAKGPESTLYVASTALGTVQQMHIQADWTLTEGDRVANVKRPIDNIHVTEDGEVVLATIPKVLKFVERAKKAGGSCETEVWSVRNETSDQKFYGSKYSHSLLYADAVGDVAPGTTNAQLYKGKLYLTGLTTPNLVVCEHSTYKR